MIKYHTDKHGRFNGKQSVARRNPNYKPGTHVVADKYIYNPRTESLVEPVKTVENEGIFLVNRTWVKKVDRIGQHYYERNGTKVEITEPGVDVPVGCLQVEPLSVYHDSHDGAAWVENITLKAEAETEAERVAEHKVEQASFTFKTLFAKEQWVKDRLQETTLDAASKVAMGRIFKRLIAFIE